MKVLLLTTHLNKGGITSYLFALSQGLIAEGAEVHVASSGGEMDLLFEVEGVKLLTLNIRTKSELDPRLYLSLPKVAAYIKNNSIDIVHAQTRVTQVMAQLLKRFYGISYVTTWHGYFKPQFFRKNFPCMGSRVIAISQGVAKHLLEDFSVSSSKVRLIHNGIDAARFKPVSDESKRVLKKNWVDEDIFLIGHIGRLSDVKGQDILIKAMKDIIQKIPSAKLMIVGRGREEDALKQLADSLGLKSHIIFLQDIENISELIPAFDVVVMPSRQEGLGLSIMEAQASCVPVIGTKVGGIPDLIEHGKTGWLIEKEDPKAVAEAVIQLYNDKKLRVTIGQNARDFILAQFYSEKMVKETLNLYKEAILVSKHE